MRYTLFEKWFLKYFIGDIGEETTTQLPISPCLGFPEWIGDFICDEQNLNQNCFFDGGDCCNGLNDRICIGLEASDVEEQECQCGELLSDNKYPESRSIFNVNPQLKRLNIEKDTKIIGGNDAIINSIPWQIGKCDQINTQW